MTDRERLVGLIFDVAPYSCSEMFAVHVADHLLANGVTFKATPKTQIDRIRAMSDKEFVEWLGNYILSTLDYSGIEHDGFNDGEYAKLLKLLQTPLED